MFSFSSFVVLFKSEYWYYISLSELLFEKNLKKFSKMRFDFFCSKTLYLVLLTHLLLF